MGEMLLQFFSFLIAIIFLPVGFFLFYSILYYINQPRILFLPQVDLQVHDHRTRVPHREIFYRTGDGITISAWFVPAKNETDGVSSPVVLFCHGNVGDISQRVDSFKIFQELGLDTFIFDYRGYGKSGGKPSEKGTYLDADGAWSYLVEVLHYKPEDIIVFGRSLGGAVAGYLASTYFPRACILESSFTSIPEMAVLRYWRLSVKWFTRYQYNTLKRLKDIHCPVLVIHSPEDELIPFIHGQRLYDTANPPKQFLKMRGKHLLGFVHSGSCYVDGLKQFIQGLDEGTEPHPSQGTP